LCTTSFLGQLGSYTGKMYFSYNLLNTLAYGYFIYLTLLYNKSVPDPREKRRVYESTPSRDTVPCGTSSTHLLIHSLTHSLTHSG